MVKFFREKLRKVPAHIWILAVIVLLGTFLRTYNFHNWLDFGSDQVNDAIRVGDVVSGKAPWPLLGPDMSNSGNGIGGRGGRFHVGPMYYYFEITSAKIFGNKPDSMAYPDMLFGILSVPLFYLFLRRYFGINISLALSGLYSISFYALSFSHSAWNPNSIPFFTLLFLLSLHEFLVAKEKILWVWILLLGVALGVGVQLHAILLVLFPATAFFVFIFLMKKDRRIWKKWAVVALCALALNLGQIKSELSTNFKNSKIFFSSLSGSAQNSQGGQGTFTENFANDLSCHIEANTYILIAVGNGNCSFSFAKILGVNASNKSLEKIKNPLFLSGMLEMLIFSVFGYGMIIFRFRGEKDERKKYFLGLLILYGLLSFFVLLPVIDAATRYFVHMIFLPFVFLGILLELLAWRYPKKFFFAVIPLLLALVATNLFALKSVIKGLHIVGRVDLGETESMVGFMISESGSSKEMYLLSKNNLDNYFKSLDYVSTQKGFKLSRASSPDSIPPGAPVFFLGGSADGDPGLAINGHESETHENFTDTAIFKLQN